MSLKAILKKTKAYEIGLAQMLAVKSSGNRRSQILEQYGLVSIEWFILGMVCDETPAGGIRVTDLATTLDVKTTYVTSVLRSLKDKELVETRKNPQDARERFIVATPKTYQIINSVEEELRDRVDAALSDRITDEQFRSYIYVLQEIARVSE
jgi:DNA-binding MarR family transcriptional regulator